MRRLFTTLMILLVVLIVGLSALVLLVNPDDFRAAMVRNVEERSGYRLQLDGPLRWHVWPQLSILSGHMSLTAPGASQPMVSAQNMRLDVALLPLLSHQLNVQQVMLKGAVIQLTSQSEGRPPPGAPVAPGGKDRLLGNSDWSYDISRLVIVDSLMVFQRQDDEQITVRNINLNMEQDEHRQATIELSGQINRDQRDLSLSLSGRLDAQDYPHHLVATISRLNWQLQGSNLPSDGIRGEGSVEAQWQERTKMLSFIDLALTVNNSRLKGSGSVVLTPAPRWMLDLKFDVLDVDRLLLSGNVPMAHLSRLKNQAPVALPVIASDPVKDDYRLLRGFTGAMVAHADRVRWRGLDFTDVTASMENNAGQLSVNTLTGLLGEGHLSLPGHLDARASKPAAVFQPVISNIEIGDILQAFHYPLALSGRLSTSGKFSGDNIDADAFRQRWKGEARITMTDTRMQGMNFQQLIQQAVERSSSVKAQRNFDNVTMLDRFDTTAYLDRGQLSLQEMKGKSSSMSLDGTGTLDLVKQLCDTYFNVRVFGGWVGESELIEKLKSISIPLRIYGEWTSLSYNLDVNKVLRKQLQDEAKRRVNDWATRHKESPPDKAPNPSPDEHHQQ